jgi:hypothetical protein
MGSALHLAKRAAQGVYYLKGLVNSEKYKHDVTSSGTLGDTGTIIHLTSVAQGDGEGERTGNSIFVRSVWSQLKLYRDVSVGMESQLLRVALILDTQQVGDTPPTFSNIYQGLGPLTGLDETSVGRYKVLWSKHYTLDKANVTSRYVNVYKKMRHHVRFNGAASSDIQKGGLYLVMSSDQTSSGFPSYDLFNRVSYHDN